MEREWVQAEASAEREDKMRRDRNPQGHVVEDESLQFQLLQLGYGECLPAPTLIHHQPQWAGRKKGRS